jgi:hypothetical protein
VFVSAPSASTSQSYSMHAPSESTTEPPASPPANGSTACTRLCKKRTCRHMSGVSSVGNGGRRCGAPATGKPVLC